MIKIVLVFLALVIGVSMLGSTITKFLRGRQSAAEPCRHAAKCATLWPRRHRHCPLRVRQGMMRALVTGGAKRIGRSIALYLAGRGFDVAVHYATSRTEADQTVADIAALGRQAVALQADLLDEAALAGTCSRRRHRPWRTADAAGQQRLDLRI